MGQDEDDVWIKARRLDKYTDWTLCRNLFNGMYYVVKVDKISLWACVSQEIRSKQNQKFS